jgi:hypothetical protein
VRDSLIPNLFKIYINDLPDIFDGSCHPVTLETLSSSILAEASVCLYIFLIMLYSFEPIFWFCIIRTHKFDNYL